MTQKNDKLYHLDKLENFMSHDEAAVKNMVGLFLQTTPELLASINKGFQEKDAVLLTKSAHTLKPTLDIFGVDAMYNPIRQIEKAGKESLFNPETKQLIDQLNQMMNKVFADLKAKFEL